MSVFLLLALEVLSEQCYQHYDLSVFVVCMLRHLQEAASVSGCVLGGRWWLHLPCNWT